MEKIESFKVNHELLRRILPKGTEILEKIG